MGSAAKRIHEPLKRQKRKLLLKRGMGKKRNERERADGHQGRAFADRSRQGDDQTRQNPTERIGQDMVVHGLPFAAPSAKAASRMLGGTVRIASRVVMITIGRIARRG